ncbi:alpha/beta fold hydrolase [Blastococcus sp. SYSU DS1024]
MPGDQVNRGVPAGRRRAGPRARRAGHVARAVAPGLAAALATVYGVYRWNNVTYDARDRRWALRSGIRVTRHDLPDGPGLNVAEGPDAGPPLLLLHGQGSAWESYARVLPALAEQFHVHAVDVVGHGGSDRTPGGYDVHTIGRDLARFVDRVIGGPVLLSGHSSGGLLAAWLAANRPDLVRGILFEDPPFFSSDPDRMAQHFAFVDLFRPAHDFLHQDDEDDFVSYYMAHNTWTGYFGRGRDRLVGYAQRYRRRHPGERLRIPFLPPVINEGFAHLHRFDPAFADAFYTCHWQAGFDQAATLAAIGQPAILVHANWRITDDGILEGAMTDDDAARAGEPIAQCTIERVDTGHGFHFEDPDRFVELVRELDRRLPA